MTSNEPLGLEEMAAARAHPQAAHEGLETAIRLRWVLRDIKAKRTNLSPANPDDIEMLVKMALVEMRDNVPVLTSEGHLTLD
jgi:hypothetical protein